MIWETRKYWGLKEEAEDRNDNLSHENKGGIPISIEFT